MRPSFSTGDGVAMPDAEPATALHDIALDWLLRAQQAPADPTLQAALAHWLQTAPEHQAAYRKAERIWHLTGQLPASTTEQWPLPPALPVAARRERRWPAWAAGLAACLLLALAPHLWLQAQADYQTTLSERRSVDLPDGSRVHLDANSAIVVTFSGNRRNVELLKGQAFFRVAPDASKPFHVLAADLDVTVTGTAFNVDLGPGNESVAVDHGSVRVQQRADGKVLSPGLIAGQQLNYDPADRNVVLGQLPVSQIAPWRQHQLIANNARVGDVVRQLERYLPGKVVLRDDALADLRVTGLYDLEQPDAALRAVLQPHGGKVVVFWGYVRVVSR
ncbi:MAG: FecR domain-containing protein [Pseudomonas sp.]|nr:FecR domain-containing protein [Pseudomonas sp.]